MADFEKKVSLIEVEVDNASAKKAVEELSAAIVLQKNAVQENNKEIKDLNAANKDLEKQVKAGTISEEKAAKAIEENTKKTNNLKVQNFALSDGLKDLNKERRSAVKASTLQSNSLDALRKKVADQKKELNGLNTETVEGRKRFDQLTVALKDNNEKIRELDQGAGDYKTTVGNYREEVSKALKETGLFGGTIGRLTEIKAKASAGAVAYKTAIVGTTTATTAASKAAKLFKIALASTGIGLIVVALGALISYLTTTQEGMDAVTSVTRPLFAVFERLKGIVQTLGQSVFKGLAQILNGDIKDGLNTLKNGAVDAVGSVGDAVKEGVEIGGQLDKLQKSIEKTEISLIKNRARLNNEFEKQKAIAEDVTQTEEKRIAAAKASQAALLELQAEEQKLIDLKIKKLETDQTLNDTNRTGEKEMAELIAQRTDFEAAATAKRVSVRNLENSIYNQIANEQKARNQEAAKSAEEMSKQQAAQRAADLAEEQKLADDRAKQQAAQRAADLAEEQKLAEEKAANEEILNTKLLALAEFRRSQANEKRLSEIEDMREYYATKAEIEMENFELEQERILEENEIVAENELLTAEEKAIRIAENDLILEELAAGHKEKMVNIANAQKNEELAIEDEKAAKRESILRKSMQASQQAVNTGFTIANNMIENFYSKRLDNAKKQLEAGTITEEQYAKKKESLAKNEAKSKHKAAVAEFRVNQGIALVQAGIDLGKAIAMSVSTTPMTGGLPFSAISAALIGAQIVAIASQKPPPPPQFASGGDVFGMIAGGKLHSQGGTKYTGEDGNAFEVERDEGIFVTKREATNPALQMLNAANTAHGGSSMFGNSSRFLQDGGEAVQENTDRRQMQMMTEAMANMPAPIVEVQSIIGGVNSEASAKKVGVI